MTIPVPSVTDVRALSDRLGLGLDDDDLGPARDAVAAALGSYERVQQMSGTAVPQRHLRPQVVPARENPYGAWLYRQPIAPTASGALDGLSVVVKDNIAVAGLPMTIGSRLLKNHVPTFDATVVSRLLAAGAQIAGSAACEDLCFSGNSFTNALAPTRNPYDATRSSGGSSSGCAALVALGEVDAAIGADQGGSVRGPAAWCGITGLKPTYGLVPYTGIAAVEMTVDHAGPLARTARDVARVLDAIAGPDGRDPRQCTVLADPRGYAEQLGGGIAGVQVAVVREGFGWPGLSDESVDATVRDAARSLEKLGCVVDEISIPWHRDAVHVFTPIMAEGSTATMLRGGGAGNNWRGWYDTELLNAFRAGWRSRTAEVSKSSKMQFLIGAYADSMTGGYFYALAQNLVPTLSAAYAAAHAAYDVLVMPTLPMMPRVLPTTELPAADYLAQALDMSCNNCAFNLTGAPSLSIPVGLVDGLPVGMMLNAAPGRDAELLRIADVVQRELLPVPSPGGMS